MNNGILQALLSFINQILDLAGDIYIYNDNGIRVSLISFFVSLSIFGIVLVALLNFVRQAPVDIISNVKSEKQYQKRRERYKRGKP